jgi:hypothetical protein
MLFCPQPRIAAGAHVDSLTAKFTTGLSGLQPHWSSIKTPLHHYPKNEVQQPLWHLEWF